VHCVSTPVVAAFLPSLGLAFGLAHPVLFVSVLAVALWAFVPAYRHHGDTRVLLLACAGLTLLAVAAFLSASLVVETGLSLLGATLMLAAHWRNRQRLRRCSHVHG
jgi:uncharacterized membrane protein